MNEETVLNTLRDIPASSARWQAIWSYNNATTTRAHTLLGAEDALSLIGWDVFVGVEMLRKRIKEARAQVKALRDAVN